jgi:hypothetical protein
VFEKERLDIMIEDLEAEIAKLSPLVQKQKIEMSKVKDLNNDYMEKIEDL